MNPCTAIGRFLGHHYQPRVSTVRYESTSEAGTVSYREQKYHGEVCSRCGHRLDERSTTPLRVHEGGMAA